MKNNKGFTLIEGLLLLVIIGIIGGTGYYVWHSKQQTNKNLTAAQDETSAVKVTKKTAAAANSSPGQTADWTAYSDKAGQFSLKYPKTWYAPSKQGCEVDSLILLGADSKSAGHYCSDGGGQMSIASNDGNLTSDSFIDYKNGDGYRDVVTEAVTVDGVKGFKQTATVSNSGDTGLGLADGINVTHYYFYTNNKTYTADYVADPSFPNALDDFNSMVTETLKFSS